MSVNRLCMPDGAVLRQNWILTFLYFRFHPGKSWLDTTDLHGFVGFKGQVVVEHAFPLSVVRWLCNTLILGALLAWWVPHRNL